MNRKTPSRPTTVALSFLALALVALPISAADYDIDPVHSSAIFKVKHFETAYFYGAFKSATGTVSYDAADPAKSSISVTIKADSVDTRNEQRDGHVKSPDFLNAQEFPNITFESTSVKSLGGDALEVQGTLTLLGVKKPVTAKVTKTGEGKNPRSQKDIIGFEAMFSVDRTEHDMSFMAGPLSKDIHFILSIEAVKQ